MLAFKLEAVQFSMAKNLAVNHLPLGALPDVELGIANCKSDGKTMVTRNEEKLLFPSLTLLIYQQY